MMSQKICFALVAEEAASGETKEMASLMMKDAEEREKSVVESNRCMMEHLNGMVKGDFRFSSGKDV